MPWDDEVEDGTGLEGVPEEPKSTAEPARPGASLLWCAESGERATGEARRPRACKCCVSSLACVCALPFAASTTDPTPAGAEPEAVPKAKDGYSSARVWRMQRDQWRTLGLGFLCAACAGALPAVCHPTWAHTCRS
jgi:hypothetical protein